MSISDSCQKCVCGIRPHNNTKEPEYYSQYYTKPFIPRPIKYYISPCNCWHGNFIENFYIFPRIQIYSYQYDNMKNVSIRFLANSKLYTIYDILAIWIKHKKLDTFLEEML